MERLTGFSKFLIAAILLGSGFGAYHTHGDWLKRAYGSAPEPGLTAQLVAHPESQPSAATGHAPAAPAHASAATARPRLPSDRKVRVAISEWPGHMPLLIGAGGLTTQPGSPAADEQLDLEIVFIEEAARKNKALLDGDVHFIWTTVDEMPISIGGYRAAGKNARAILQIDWSRGGDACVAAHDVKRVEDILGRSSAMMMFSPDHTVFEFMITNSRLTPAQVADVRRATRFSMDDFTFGRLLFAQGKVDVACLWEPDVTLALESRPGAHRLFSTADATELVADVLLAREDVLETHRELAQKLARVWFRAVEQAERDRPAAARLISSTSPRFRDEMGYSKTLQALDWVRWTNLADNVRFFGLDGTPPAFDRVYNQADSIWITYPQAEIHDRFAPVTLRDDRVVKALWEAAGKPAPRATEEYQPQVALKGRPVFTKPVSINFSTASSVLDAEAIALINREIVPQLEIARAMYARIEGNTDSVGDRDDNQKLSERRAWTIVEYLVSRGIARERLVARGNGSSSPVANNKTPEGRAMNRRTDIVFIKDWKG
jgi:outer membrane protein OmpA-like peptidoglycan-associated protein/ABC-type nitrate/sulfonate/bicarbonate transport system substrate-binding protein